RRCSRAWPSSASRSVFAAWSETACPCASVFAICERDWLPWTSSPTWSYATIPESPRGSPPGEARRVAELSASWSGIACRCPSVLTTCRRAWLRARRPRAAVRLMLDADILVIDDDTHLREVVGYALR